MIALIFATCREAKPFLRKTGLDLADSAGPSVFDLRPGQPIVVCICGMGPSVALAHTRCLLNDYPVTSVINAGIAGAVTEGKIPEDVFRITSILTWPGNTGAYPCATDRWHELKSASLATVEKPVFDPELRQKIATVADLVDMEGAYIAQACREKNIPCHAIKGVTDLAGEGDRKTLYANIDKVCETIADLLWKEFGAPLVAACLRMPIGAGSRAAPKNESTQLRK